MAGDLRTNPDETGWARIRRSCGNSAAGELATEGNAVAERVTGSRVEVSVEARSEAVEARPRNDANFETESPVGTTG